MGGGWRVCLHRSRGPGHRLPDAHAQCPWIQVRSNMSLKGITRIHHCISQLGKLNEMSLVYTGCLSPWPKTVKGVNSLALPLFLRPGVRLTASSTSWRWEKMFSHTCFRMHTYKEVKRLASVWTYMRWVLFLRRVIISGIMMWWSSGKAATGNSRTPTWSRATAPPASPGHFSEQRS